MVRSSNDPFSGLAVWQRWSLQARLRRSWRLGSADRDALTAQRLTESAEGRPVLAMWNTGPDRHARTAAAIRFGDDLTVRLGGCHWPTVTVLERINAEASLYLEIGRHHGKLWGLYFCSAGERFALLARRVCIDPRNPPGLKGVTTVVAPAAPAAV